jgi:cell division protein FtsX
VIRLGLRLTLRGGREAAVRFVVIAAAVALGVALLLATLAGIRAVDAQNTRYAWLETGTGGARSAAPAAERGTQPVWWRLQADEFDGQLIGRIDVATTGPNPPVPPGMADLPAPGAFVASPAMSRLLATTPPAELAARYPGLQAGVIGDAALPSPDSLVIVVGRTASELSADPHAQRVSSISRTPPDSCNGPCYSVGIDSSGMDLVLSVVAAALVFPVLIFIGTSTRLAAARREQRFAALRLVGATPGQVSVISTVESTAAAVAGLAAGFGLYAVLRPALAAVPLTGERFFSADVALTLADVLLVVFGVPVAAAVAARLALRRVVVSPLGTSRRTTPRAPGTWRLIPLAAGLAELTWFVVVGRPDTTQGQIQAYLSGILVTMTGLVLAGPWLAAAGARLLARRAERPAALIAGRRLADDPRGGFRAVSGLVLALFVSSVAVGLITTISAYAGGRNPTAAERATLVADVATITAAGGSVVAEHPGAAPATLPAIVRAELQGIAGVRAVTVVHGDPHVPDGGLVSCADLRRTPVLGRCPAGAVAVRAPFDFAGAGVGGPSMVWRDRSPVAAGELAGLPVRTVVVGTDGSRAAVERSRTVLEAAYPGVFSPVTLAEDAALNPGNRLIAQYQQLAAVVVLTSLPIAGCTLAVGVVAGLNDRRRPFALLRLAGTPLAVLRRVVLLESAVPLLLVAAVALGTGFLTAFLFLRSQLDQTLQPPSATYYLAVGGGLVLSLAIIASTLPVLRRITGPESARAE